MQHTICGFQQMRLCELGLDSIDVIILRWFIDFYHTDKMEKTQDGAWVKYSYVIKSLPILGFRDKQTIAYRFDKMVQSGLLKKTIDKKDGKIKARFLLNSVEYSKLIEQPIRSEQYTLYGSDRIPYTVETVYIDSSNNNSSNKDNKPPISPINESQNSISITANGVCDSFSFIGNEEIQGDLENHQKHPVIAAGGVIKTNNLPENSELPILKIIRNKEKKQKVISSETEIQFTKFWKSYPALKKGARSIALKSWIKLAPSSELFDKILLAISHQIQERELFKKLGVFHPNWPYASTWLNQRVWEEEVCLDEKLILQSAPMLSKDARQKLEQVEFTEKRKRADEARIALEKRRRVEEEELERTKSERAKAYIENHSSKIKQVLDDAVKAIKINPWSTNSNSGGMLPKN